MSPVSASPLRRRMLARALACALALGTFSGASTAAETGKRSYHLPADDAAQALKRFSRQSGRGVIVGAEAAKHVQTNAVDGEFSPEEAIERMLAGTGLVASRDEKSGAFAVRSAEPVAATGSRPSPPAASVCPRAAALEEEPAVALSAFHVSTAHDEGYRASNSISGSRFDTRIEHLPFALQAFTEDFIADLKPMNIQDIALYSPGVTYRSNDFNEGDVNLAVRGYEAGAILRDGFKGPRVLDFANVARLEIVKGPASFLYGQIAPGGVVNAITKSPQKTRRGTVALSYGSYHEYRASLDLTGPVTEGLYYRFVTAHHHDLEYWKPYDSDQRTYAPQLLWQLNDRATISLKYERLEKRESPPLMQLPGYTYSEGPIPTAADPNLSGVASQLLPDHWNSMADSDYRHSDSDNLTAALDLAAGEHWSTRFAYSHARDAIDANYSGNLGLANGSVYQGRRWRGQTYTYTSDALETQALGTYDLRGTSLKLLVGGLYTPYRFDYWAGQIPNDPTLAGNPVAGPLPAWDLTNPATWNRTLPSSFTRDRMTAHVNAGESETTDRALYAGATAGFFRDRLRLLGGLRRTLSETRSHTRLATNSASEITAQNTASRFEAAKNSPQIGALCKLTPALSLFASYSESFVPQPRFLYGYRKNTPTWESVLKGPARPTDGSGYDLGLKASLLDGRLSGTLTYFRIDNKNIINDIAELNPTTGAQWFENLQSGKQRAEGVEIDVTWTPSDRWQLYASASFADSRILYLLSPEQDAAYLAQANDLAALDATGLANFKNVYRFHGRPLQMSAPRQYSLWTRYDFAGRLEGLYVGGGAVRLENQTILADTPAWADQTYTLWSALVGYRLKLAGLPTSLELNGRNLGNEHYRPSQSSRSRPREVLFSVTTRF